MIINKKISLHERLEDYDLRIGAPLISLGLKVMGGGEDYSWRDLPEPRINDGLREDINWAYSEVQKSYGERKWSVPEKSIFCGEMEKRIKRMQEAGLHAYAEDIRMNDVETLTETRRQ